MCARLRSVAFFGSCRSITWRWAGSRVSRSPSSPCPPARVRRALPYVRPDRLVLAPDCGMKYLPRASASGKLSALTEAARTLRAELAVAGQADR